ncbi:MAG: gliding motility-associated C-terminal domain-containing protein [Chitinophagaceae bacterium]|nr:MAG: gliding motility-associated C-terminal domain-containing protein [Chitinophagaceae bacterium]
MNLPNAFSPNGDGKNEIFRVINGQQIEKLRLEIFNRFGQKVFETDDYKAGWDGNLKGVAQPAGIYIWSCKFTQTRIDMYRKGVVALIR